jgi:hypothetical protein
MLAGSLHPRRIPVPEPRALFFSFTPFMSWLPTADTGAVMAMINSIPNGE